MTKKMILGWHDLMRVHWFIVGAIVDLASVILFTLLRQKQVNVESVLELHFVGKHSWQRKALQETQQTSHKIISHTSTWGSRN